MTICFRKVRWCVKYILQIQLWVIEDVVHKECYTVESQEYIKCKDVWMFFLLTILSLHKNWCSSSTWITIRTSKEHLYYNRNTRRVSWNHSSQWEQLKCTHTRTHTTHRLWDYWHFKGRKPLLGQLPAPSHLAPFAGMASPDERALWAMWCLFRGT